MCPGHGQNGHKLKSNVLTGPKGDCKVISDQSWQQLLKNIGAGVDGLNREESTGSWEFKEFSLKCCTDSSASASRVDESKQLGTESIEEVRPGDGWTRTSQMRTAAGDPTRL